MKLSRFAIVFLLFLTACAPASMQEESRQQTLTESTPVREPIEKKVEVEGTTQADAPGRDNTSGASDTVIIYRVSGGLAGENKQWTIYSDGSVATGEDEKYVVEAAEVSQLIREIEDLGFMEMEAARSSPFSACRDCFTYEISVSSGGRTNTVAAEEGSQDVPPEFWQVAESVFNFIERLPQ